MADLFAALREVSAALDRLRVRHYVGGSFASSVHGLGRASLDVDIVAELDRQHVAALVAALAPAFYLDEERVTRAIDRRSSFNVIHLRSAVKIDLFVASGRPFDDQAMSRAHARPLTDEPTPSQVPVASAEDTVLAKLEWFRKGGEVSQRQWLDVLGVLAVQSEALDRGYLNRWATDLGVSDLLERALAEASRLRA